MKLLGKGRVFNKILIAPCGLFHEQGISHKTSPPKQNVLVKGSTIIMHEKVYCNTVKDLPKI